VSYIQGMNEVLATLYICFVECNQGVVETRFIESDLFVVFSNIMIELRDSFMRELDKEEAGL
jgi:hypothetical protein